MNPDYSAAIAWLTEYMRTARLEHKDALEVALKNLTREQNIAEAETICLTDEVYNSIMNGNTNE